MALTLLISLKNHQKNQNWSLVQEIRGAVARDDIKPLQNDGVIPIGRDAFLFDQSVAHNTFVRVCAHLIAHEWPYLVAQLGASSILLEGKFESGLQAIVENLKARDDLAVPRVP